MSIWTGNQKSWKPVSKLLPGQLCHLGNFHLPVTRKEAWLLPHFGCAHYKGVQGRQQYQGCSASSDLLWSAWKVWKSMWPHLQQGGSVQEDGITWQVYLVIGDCNRSIPCNTALFNAEMCLLQVQDHVSASFILLSAAVNTALKVYKPWALLWEWEAVSLAHCAEGSMALQRTAISCDAKSLA